MLVITNVLASEMVVMESLGLQGKSYEAVGQKFNSKIYTITVDEDLV
ncbi:MAG: hypothetical protein QW837_07015 [Conexivisphaerales archaeon]